MGTARDVDSGRVDSIGRAIKVAQAKAAHPASQNRPAPSVNDELTKMGQEPVTEEEITEAKIDLKIEEITDRLDGMEDNDSFRFDDGAGYPGRSKQFSAEDIATEYAIAVDGEGEDSDYQVIMSWRNSDDTINEANERAMGLSDPSSLPEGWSYDDRKGELSVPISKLPRSDSRSDREKEIIESFAYLGEDGPVLDTSVYREVLDEKGYVDDEW